MSTIIYHLYRIQAEHLCKTLGITSIHWYEVPKLISIATDIMSYIDRSLCKHTTCCCCGQTDIIDEFLKLMMSGNNKIIGVDYEPVMPDETIDKVDASILNSIKFFPLSDGTFSYDIDSKTITYSCPDKYWEELGITGITKAQEDIVHFINGLKNPYNFITEIRLGSECYHYLQCGCGWVDDNRNKLIDEAIELIKEDKKMYLIISDLTILLLAVSSDYDGIDSYEDEIILDPASINSSDETEETETTTEETDENEYETTSKTQLVEFMKLIGISDDVLDTDFVFTWTSIMTAIHIALHYTYPELFTDKPIEYNSDLYYVPEGIVNDSFWFNLK